MNIIIAFFIGAIAGFSAGFLVFRNNAKKLQNAEKNMIDIASKFKGE